MRAALFACAALLAAGVAFAQELRQTAVPQAFQPNWQNFRVSHVQYPAEALRHGMAGLAILCCDARENRTADCQVGFEWPADQHFGAATRTAFQGLRLTPDSYAELQARPSQHFAVPFAWQLDPAPPEMEGVAARARADSTDVCGPGTGPLPEFAFVTAQVRNETRGSARGFDRDIPGSLPQSPEH